MGAKLAGAVAQLSLGYSCAEYSPRTEPQESGKRQKPHPTTSYAHLYSTKRGLPKAERRPFAAMSAMKNVALKIRHGNRVSVVVSGWESHLHGEGKQFVLQYKMKKGA